MCGFGVCKGNGRRWSLAREASGLSVAAFCRRERINAWTLYGWRSRLRGAKGKVEREAPVVEPSGGFIDLGALRAGRAGRSVSNSAAA